MWCEISERIVADRGSADGECGIMSGLTLISLSFWLWAGAGVRGEESWAHRFCKLLIWLQRVDKSEESGKMARTKISVKLEWRDVSCAWSGDGALEEP